MAEYRVFGNKNNPDTFDKIIEATSSKMKHFVEYGYESAAGYHNRPIAKIVEGFDQKKMHGHSLHPKEDRAIMLREELENILGNIEALEIEIADVKDRPLGIDKKNLIKSILETIQNCFLRVWDALTITGNRRLKEFAADLRQKVVHLKELEKQKSVDLSDDSDEKKDDDLKKARSALALAKDAVLCAYNALDDVAIEFKAGVMKPTGQGMYSAYETVKTKGHDAYDAAKQRLKTLGETVSRPFKRKPASA
jgi:hypothetical protein